MTHKIELSELLADGSQKDRLVVFAFLGLGLIESLKSGTLAADDAVRVFFNSANCLFVKNSLRSTTANRIMSHGVQLPDLFEVLERKAAKRELNNELEVMSLLCLRLLGSKRVAA